MSYIDSINVGGVDFDINSSPIPAMATIETGTTATRAYAIGDYVIVGIELHQVTAAIAIGDEFEEGVNISSPTSLANKIKENSVAINQLNASLTELSSDVSEQGTLVKLFDGITTGINNKGITINLKDSIANYRYIVFTSGLSALNRSMFVGVVPTSLFRKYDGDTTNGYLYYTNHFHLVSTGAVDHRMQYISDTSLFICSGSGASNAYLGEIYGIK